MNNEPGISGGGSLLSESDSTIPVAPLKLAQHWCINATSLRPTGVAPPPPSALRLRQCIASLVLTKASQCEAGYGVEQDGDWQREGDGGRREGGIQIWP